LNLCSAAFRRWTQADHFTASDQKGFHDGDLSAQGDHTSGNRTGVDVHRWHRGRCGVQELQWKRHWFVPVLLLQRHWKKQRGPQVHVLQRQGVSKVLGLHWNRSEEVAHEGYG